MADLENWECPWSDQERAAMDNTWVRTDDAIGLLVDVWIEMSDG